MYYSPLRYPGGKNKLSAFIARVCQDNNINGHYVEPYSGGASVALFLLNNGIVDEITINDKDRSIFAFWHSVLNQNDELCNRILDSKINIKEWRTQKNTQKNKNDVSLIDLGFSTFYLNRTNRSGIINAGVIGGVEQKGNYLMDCRFNKEKLITRIRNIVKLKNQINLFSMDAIELVKGIQKKSNYENTIIYFDPPYFQKGNTLYMNHYKISDHKNVCDSIKSMNDMKWIVSYDNVPEIRELYKEFPRKEFSFKHTAYKSRIGKEILFFSDNLKEPNIEDYNPLKFKKEKKNLDIVYSC